MRCAATDGTISVANRLSTRQAQLRHGTGPCCDEEYDHMAKQLANVTAWMPYGIGTISLGKTRSEELLAYCKAYALNADADLSEM